MLKVGISRRLSLIELIVIVLIVAMILAISVPPLSKIKKHEAQVVCEVNMKSLGDAMSIYSSDHADVYPELPGRGSWSKELGFAYDLPNPDFAGVQASTPRTVTASWYLLVRYSDVSPQSFVCPGRKQKSFLEVITQDVSIVKLWDFGSNPYDHVSYSMHNPYGKYPANKNRSSGFAIAADNNPWFKDGSLIEPNKNSIMPPQIINYQNDKTYKLGNSMNHKEYKERFLFWKYTKRGTLGLGQNVLYNDGSVVFKETPNCGINNDNIYTFWSNNENPTEQDIHGGTNPKERNLENDAKSEEDSFLVL